MASKKTTIANVVRIVGTQNPETQQTVTIAPEEQELADALISIADKYGKFNEDSVGIWAGYEEAEENDEAEIGVKCFNCLLYRGGNRCRIIARAVEPNGKCRFAVIPDGVVSKD